MILMYTNDLDEKMEEKQKADKIESFSDNSSSQDAATFFRNSGQYIPLWFKISH